MSFKGSFVNYAKILLDLKVEDSSSEVEVKRMLCRQREHMERTVNELRAKLAKSAEDHEKVYVRIMKVKRGKSFSSSDIVELSLTASLLRRRTSL